MSSQSRTSARIHIASVASATAIFVLIALVLAALMTHVIGTMTTSANEIDDRRAVRAASSALEDIKSRISATVRDNSVWDEAYAAITSDKASEWSFDNWGKTSEDYPLYDGAIVIGPKGEIISAYHKGEVFDPHSYFGEAYSDQVESAEKPDQDPSVGFMKTPDGIAVVASGAIQPFAGTAKEERLSVLTFYKILTPEVISQIASQHELTDLRLVEAARRGLLNSALKDGKGNTLAYLDWPTKAPGTQVFEQVYPYVLAAVAVLGLFLVTVLLAGTAEARRLRGLARSARFEATHDGLSSLLNRSGLLDALDERGAHIGGSKHLTLHLVDLDGFKAVNDAWGHAVGDELIRMVAKALEVCHEEIAIAARLGGDEFALVQVGSAEPHQIARAILSLFETPFKIGGRTIEVGASIGSASQEHGVPPLELLRRADMALYRAKESGKGRLIGYDPELDRDRLRLAELENELRQALANGEIQPVFQPLVSAATGRMTSVESLARWRGKNGHVSPAIFIPLAEKSGLIDALGTLMLKSSVIEAREWDGIGLSVNVSPIQLCNPDFASTVLSVMRELDFDPKRLTLEITEGVLMSNPDQARRTMDALKAVGVGFALDDFGCGYASIGALRQFGFNRMKVDRSLVSGIEEGRGVMVLQATISLAMALGIPVTAEGVENRYQADVLKRAGCDLLQGYHLGRPVAAEEITKALKEKAAIHA
jgi:diguanylate cyclase (GGDEF)-like protein